MDIIKRNPTIKVICLLTVLAMLIGIAPLTVTATTSITDVPGKVYEFDKDGHYEFADSDRSADSSENNTYGSFSVSGNIASVDSKDGVPAYEVAEGDLSFFYNYTDSILNADLDSWHLVEDKSKKVNGQTLDSNIMNGAIILQTSKDRLNWINVGITTNAFADTPVRTDAIYKTTDVQLINGCFYRVIVVYELRIRTNDSNFLFINTDTFEHKKCAEVYEFYAYIDSNELSSDAMTEPYNLGKRVRVADFEKYYGEQPITEDDPHKDWSLGQFFVGGYTDDMPDSNGNVVFLKNVGDQITLWFTLNENIDCLRGKENLSVTADGDGYDQYFEKGPMDFGRGVLFVKHTDRNNNIEITTYTNFLEANAVVGADTKVRLFEEGDYEVALDYEITDNQLIDKIYHYRISFKFSVRNGNCMFYLFDKETGSELSNSTMTENGFRLDLAKSEYLHVTIKREVLKDSADGLVEDTRFNGVAKDGAEFVEEGIYTITATNDYVKEPTIKRIYVGTNNVLRAHMVTGFSIHEINDLVAQGATISDDGTIQLANITPETEAAETSDATQSPTEKPSDIEMEEPGNDTLGETETPPLVLVATVVLIAVACITVIVSIVRKRHSARQPVKVAIEETEGGAEE